MHDAGVVLKGYMLGVVVIAAVVAIISLLKRWMP